MANPLNFDFDLEKDIIPQVENALQQINETYERAVFFRTLLGLNTDDAKKALNYAKNYLNELIINTISYIKIQNKRLLTAIESMKSANEFILTVTAILISIFLYIFKDTNLIFFGIVMTIIAQFIILISIKSIVYQPRDLISGFKLPDKKHVDEWIGIMATELKMEISLFAANSKDINNKNELYRYVNIFLYPFLIMLFASLVTKFLIEYDSSIDIFMSLTTLLLILTFAVWSFLFQKLPKPITYQFWENKD
ncbi:MAG TPA: hypothetical protein ENI33_08390 [Thermoplasmatales archaeon]|nr:hypothetical protein [Thermoplasmatales archaeon]